MRFALEVWSSRFEQVEATCRLAESLGLDAFYYGESPHDLNLDCWTTLGALANATERINLGPVITNVLPTYRSTVLLAKQAATVAAVSKGRLDFRTGVGAAAAFGRPWWEPFAIQYADYDQRFSDLETALGDLQRWWSGPKIPLTIAARGRRAMGLAAEHGDVWETSFCTPTEFQEQNDQMMEVLDGREIARSLEIDAFVATTKPGLDQLLRQVTSERGSEEDLPAILDRALVGTPEDAAGRMVELASIGVDQVTIALHDPHDIDALGAISEAANIVRQHQMNSG